MRRPTPPRERRGGTCPPARPGGSFFQTQNRRSASCVPTVCCFQHPEPSAQQALSGNQQPAIAACNPAQLFLVSVFELPRHLLENPALITGEAVEPLLRDLVEHEVELFVRPLRKELGARRRR